ncbi:hypothetical protein AAF712_016853, partial [Marasmius tenuissimus]
CNFSIAELARLQSQPASAQASEVGHGAMVQDLYHNMSGLVTELANIRNNFTHEGNSELLARCDSLTRKLAEALKSIEKPDEKNVKVKVEQSSDCNIRVKKEASSSSSIPPIVPSSSSLASSPRLQSGPSQSTSRSPNSLPQPRRSPSPVIPAASQVPQKRKRHIVDSSRGLRAQGRDTRKPSSRVNRQNVTSNFAGAENPQSRPESPLFSESGATAVDNDIGVNSEDEIMDYAELKKRPKPEVVITVPVRKKKRT